LPFFPLNPLPHPHQTPLTCHLPSMLVEAFDWQRAPFGGLQYPVGASLIYLVTVLLWKTRIDGSRALSKKEDSLLVQIQGIHNLILCVWSLLMFIGCGWAFIKRVQAENSIYWYFCENPEAQAKGALYFWSYIYYLSKYYELFDTVIALLRRRPPPYWKMHIYHHSVVIFMTWFWLQHSQSLQFGGLLFNTFVHVIMYYYYFLRSQGIKPWWKNYITTIQIVQFLFSFACLIPWIVLVFGYERSCSGTPQVLFNCAFNFTLLILFMGVLNTNQKNREKEKSG